MTEFLNTGFTDLVDPQLLSVGVVAGPGSKSELYVEVMQRDRIRTHRATPRTSS